jgi:hypothetical protein
MTLDQELRDLAGRLQGKKPAPPGWDPKVWEERQRAIEQRCRDFDYEGFERLFMEYFAGATPEELEVHDGRMKEALRAFE